MDIKFDAKRVSKKVPIGDKCIGLVLIVLKESRNKILSKIRIFYIKYAEAN